MKRVIIIGLDGVPYHLIHDLAQGGTMPNCHKIIEPGTFRQMGSSLPEISSVAWSSIITGVDPGTHGIFGFTDLAPDSYRIVFPNFASLKYPAFWHQNEARRSVIINVPSTYPAIQLNGVLIAGFVALNLEKAVYPQSFIPTLKDMDYRIDVDYERASESANYFFNNLSKVLRTRISVCKHLWYNEDWDIFMLVFTGTDRLMHFFWNAYEDKSHRYHKAFLNYFHEIDEAIGKIMNELLDNDSLILLSDHGFERLDTDVYLNFLLKEEGLLKFKNEQPSSLKDITADTRAFTLDPSRLYLNIKGKYPKGCVVHKEKEKLLREIEKMFYSLEFDGKPVIKHCYRAEEIYHGPFLSQAPDMVLISNSGFNLRGTLNPAELYAKNNLTGKHTQSDAFLLLKHSSAILKIPEKPCVTDIVTIINTLQGG